MSEKQILFNTEMVRAILDGRKTQTRRVIKTGNHTVTHAGLFYGAPDEPKYGAVLENHGVIVAPYQKGDLLYVRETWDFWPCVTCHSESECCEIYPDKPDQMKTAEGMTDGCFLYRADGEAPVFSSGHIWRPSIHMPKEAARIYLRVTDVHAERLQDCGNMQAKDEGCTCCSQFTRIWDSTIKPADREKYGWAANPWVWVVTFEPFRALVQSVGKRVTA